jgi:ABC-type uncharacterized transport system permease subunit
VSVWFRVRYVRAQNDGDRSVEIEDKPLLAGSVAASVLDRNYRRQFAHVPNLRFITEGQPWTRIREFETQPAAVIAIAPVAAQQGLRHRRRRRGHPPASFDLGADATASGDPQPGVVRSLCFAPKADRLVGLDARGGLHVWTIENPHPEASLAALFGPVWYEGYVEPKNVWQSTGGSDDFEPKLGLVPLLVGTLKGTLYTMLFSVPVAVLAALYLSQLLRRACATSSNR